MDTLLIVCVFFNDRMNESVNLVSLVCNVLTLTKITELT